MRETPISAAQQGGLLHVVGVSLVVREQEGARSVVDTVATDAVLNLCFSPVQIFPLLNDIYTQRLLLVKYFFTT
jgi:hypothetical protein